MESVGAISSNDGKYVAWDTNILDRLANTKKQLFFKKTTAKFSNNSLLNFREYSKYKGYEFK
jgi:hypothetical protein